MSDSKRRSRMRIGCGLAAVLVAAGIPLYVWWWIRTNQCLPEAFDTVRMPHSDWVAEGRGMFCGFGIGGGTDIRARNTVTGEIVTIAEGYDVLDAKILNGDADHLIIQLPNRTDVIQIHDTFGPFRVSYQYFPKDDPDDRDAYRKWANDQRDPGNIEWYCKNVLSEMDSHNRRIFNQILAEDNFPDGSVKEYCRK